MAELARKKHVRAGHRGSTRKTIQRANDELALPHAAADKLSRLNLSLKEKLNVLTRLDEEILDKIEGEDAIATEIEQADTFEEEMYDIIVKLESALTSSSSTATGPTSHPRVRPASCWYCSHSRKTP